MIVIPTNQGDFVTNDVKVSQLAALGQVALTFGQTDGGMCVTVILEMSEASDIASELINGVVSIAKAQKAKAVSDQ